MYVQIYVYNAVAISWLPSVLRVSDECASIYTIRLRASATCTSASIQESWCTHLLLAAFNTSELCHALATFIEDGMLHTASAAVPSSHLFSVLPYAPGTCSVSHLPAHMPAPIPGRLELTGLFATLPCALTPSTTFSLPVSTTTPPTIISPSTACNVSKLKIKSSSHTSSKR